MRRDSLEYLVAVIAVETGISPIDLLEAPVGMLECIEDYMRRRAAESRKPRRK